MPNIVGPETIDTSSTDGFCIYPATPLGGNPYISPNVYANKLPVKIYTALSVPAPVVGVPLPSNPTGVCQPGIRAIAPIINKNVYINGQLFAVTGDEAVLGISTPRLLTGPYSYPTIQIGTQTIGV
jgi:hypothetical protein